LVITTAYLVSIVKPAYWPFLTSDGLHFCSCYTWRKHWSSLLSSKNEIYSVHQTPSCS